MENWSSRRAKLRFAGSYVEALNSMLQARPDITPGASIIRSAAWTNSGNLAFTCFAASHAEKLVLTQNSWMGELVGMDDADLSKDDPWYPPVLSHVRTRREGESRHMSPLEIEAELKWSNPGLDIVHAIPPRILDRTDSRRPTNTHATVLIKLVSEETKMRIKR